MEIDAGKVNVVHNTEARRFEIRIEEHLAELKYEMRGNTIFFTHTGVPPALEGHGLANRLAKAGLDYAREKSYNVIPACEFIDIYLKRHPEYQDLVKD